jgi:predicted RND superfamily exporter protein
VRDFGVGLAAAVRALVARRFLALGAAAVVTALLTWYGSGLAFDEDLISFLPKDDPVIAEHARAFRAFKLLDAMRVDLGPAASKEELFAAADRFEAALRAPDAAPLFSRVFSGVTDDQAASVVLAFSDLAARSLPSLVQPDEVAAIVSRYETDVALDAKLAGAFETLNTFEGQGTQTNLRRDPLGLEGAFWSRVDALRSAVPGARLERGRLVSEDGHVLFLLEPSVPSSDTLKGEEVLARVAAAAGAAAIPKAVAGGHRAAIENARTIKFDAWFTSLVSLVAMFVVYAAIFPRRWLIPLTALPLAFGGVFGGALCRLGLGRMSQIAVGFGGILLGLADDFIVHLYYFYEVRARDGHKEPSVSAVERIATPTMAAAASIAASFIALAASGFPGQRDLAVFATTSLVGTVAFTLLVQPLFLPSSQPARPLPRSGALLGRLIAWVERHEKPALALALVATVVLGAFATRIRFEDDPRAIDARSAATKRDEDDLGKRWGDPSQVALVVARGRDLEEALEANDRALAGLEAVRARGDVLGVSSIAPLLPGARTQEARRAAWAAFFTPERRARLDERVRRIGARHRFSERAFEPFFARLEGTGEPVSVALPKEGALAQLVGSRIVSDPEGTLVATFVRLKGTDEAALAWAQDFEQETGAIVTTGHSFAKALVALIRDRLARCGALGFVVVLALLVLVLRRPRAVLAAALPLALGLVWSAGIFALTDTALNAVNFLIPVLAFGLSVDYVLFLASGYLRPARDPDEVEQAQGAVFASSVTTLAGMASLLLAKHPALFSVGVVALVSTSCSLLAIFLVTPALLRPRGSARVTS